MEIRLRNSLKINNKEIISHFLAGFYSIKDRQSRIQAVVFFVARIPLHSVAFKSYLAADKKTKTILRVGYESAHVCQKYSANVLSSAMQIFCEEVVFV